MLIYNGQRALSIFNANAPLTMSSLEIATLTGKEHKNVLADTRKMLDELGIEAAEFSAPCKMPSGQNTVPTTGKRQF